MTESWKLSTHFLRTRRLSRFSWRKAADCSNRDSNQRTRRQQWSEEALTPLRKEIIHSLQLPNRAGTNNSIRQKGLTIPLLEVNNKREALAIDAERERHWVLHQHLPLGKIAGLAVSWGKRMLTRMLHASEIGLIDEPASELGQWGI